MKKIASAQGWALDIAVELDRYSIGFAGRFLRASDERRQVIAAYFAMRLPPANALESSAMNEHAELLLEANHRRILADAFGSVPAGLRQALARSGSQPHDRQFYVKLHDVLTCPPHASFKAALGQVGKLDLTQIEILQRLPQRCCSARVAQIMGTVEYAERALALVGLLAASGVDSNALTAALATIDSRHQLRDFWQRWALKASFPEHPVPEGPNYRPVCSGAELAAMSLRLRNCGTRHLAGILEKKSAFAEAGDGKGRVVVHLKCVRGKWVIDDVYGPRNGSADSRSEKLIIDHLGKWGVHEVSQGPSAGAWDPLRRLTSSYEVWEDDGENA